MTVREYIGARYVPLFIGEWDNEKTYEPLSIVQHQGNSFTSRCFVPVGIDINNEVYWAVTGNYNAQVEQYRQEVRAFDSRITQNANDIVNEREERQNADSGLGQRITDETNSRTQAISDEAQTRENADDALGMRIDEETNARESAILTLSDRIDAIHIPNKIQVFEGKNCVFIGDSFMAEGIQNSVNAYLPNTVCTILQMNKFNFAIAGAGFGREANLISRQTTNAQNQMTSEQKQNTALVIIMAGCNDLLNAIENNAISSGINDCVTKCNNMFPNSQILLIPFNFGVGQLSQAHRATILLTLNSLQILHANLPNLTIVYNAWLWNIGLFGRYQNQVHPNVSGYNVIIGNILQAINGGSTEAHYAASKSIEPYAGVSAGYISIIMQGQLLNFSGYLRNENAGAQTNVNLGAAGSMYAIATPYSQDSTIIPMRSMNNHQGYIRIDTDASCRFTINTDAPAGTTFFFNTVVPVECGLAWHS